MSSIFVNICRLVVTVPEKHQNKIIIIAIDKFNGFPSHLIYLILRLWDIIYIIDVFMALSEGIFFQTIILCSIFT